MTLRFLLCPAALDQPEQLFVSPSDVKGGAEKLSTDRTEQSNLLEVVN